MRGSSKILIALVAAMILAAPFAQARNDLGIPTDKTPGTTLQVVRFDRVLYKIAAEVPVDLYFTKIDNEHHLLYIKTVPDGVTPYCEVVIQWGGFAPVTLGIEIGGINSWILGTETGYAEK
jgi:hypothetical protein